MALNNMCVQMTLPSAQGSATVFSFAGLPQANSAAVCGCSKR